MQLKHIKESIKNKYSKGCSKGRTKNNRVIYKTQKEKYQEGLKAYKESLKDFTDYRGTSKESLMKYKEEYKRIFNKYPSKNTSIYDIKRIIKAYKESLKSI